MKKLYSAILVLLLIVSIPLSASAATCPTVPGNLWNILDQYRSALNALLAANPQLENPCMAMPDGGLNIPGNPCVPSVTCAPAVSAKPSATAKPSETPKPAETRKPANTPVPAATPNLPSGEPTAKPGDAIEITEFEMEVIRLTNEIREENGLNPLNTNENLTRVARAKSEDMRDKGYFSHTSPTYGSPFEMMRTFGIRYSSAGENIARGYKSPRAVVDAWMNSSSHRANILGTSYSEIGIGYVESGHYWTMMLIG